jgi:hypothetical protein
MNTTLLPLASLPPKTTPGTDFVRATEMLGAVMRARDIVATELPEALQTEIGAQADAARRALPMLLETLTTLDSELASFPINPNGPGPSYSVRLKDGAAQVRCIPDNCVVFILGSALSGTLFLALTDSMSHHVATHSALALTLLPVAGALFWCALNAYGWPSQYAWQPLDALDEPEESEAVIAIATCLAGRIDMAMAKLTEDAQRLHDRRTYIATHGWEQALEHAATQRLGM